MPGKYQLKIFAYNFDMVRIPTFLDTDWCIVKTKSRVTDVYRNLKISGILMNLWPSLPRTLVTLLRNFLRGFDSKDPSAIIYSDVLSKRLLRMRLMSCDFSRKSGKGRAKIAQHLHLLVITHS